MTAREWPEAPPVLTDGLVELRLWRPSDAAAVFEACQAPDIQALPNLPSPYRYEDAVQFVGEIAPMLWRTGCGANFAVEIVESSALAGACGVTRRDSSSPVAEIGYWIASAERGKGFAARAVRLAANWAFTVGGIAELELLVRPGNDASCRVAEAAGFGRAVVQRPDVIRFVRSKNG